MFKSITTFITNAVTKYKAQRVRDVVSQYYAAVDAQVTTTLPVAIEFYRGVATAVVDKTFEDPALSAEFEVFSTKLEERGTDPAMLQRVGALFKAIEDLTTDVNDH